MASVTFPKGAAVPLATITRPTPSVWLLSMHSAFESNIMDNRLTPNYIRDVMLPALDYIELEFWKDFYSGKQEAALVITGETVKNKFFSNGLDLQRAAKVNHFFRDLYYKLLTRILTFPMHTIAAINGHAFAGGMGLAIACDWRVIREERAWCCMNELDFGAVLPSGMTGILGAKLSPPVMRKVLLTAHRYTAVESLESGIVDEIAKGDGDACIRRAIEIAEAHKKYSVSGALGGMKGEVYKDAIEALKADDAFSKDYMPEILNKKRFEFLQSTAIAAKI